MSTIFNRDNDFDLSQGVGLYVHVPFCRKRCGYCDFYSQTDTSLVDAFIKGVQSDVEELARHNITIKTLYFGGGTPSLLGSKLSDLVSFIRKRLNIIDGAEITVEVNPESFSKELLGNLLTHGVNRFSIGVQALDDGVLSRVGRLHNTQRALDALKILQTAQVNFSVDLITGIPGSTPEDIEHWIEQVAAFGPQHLSLYPLSISEDCALAKDSAFAYLSEDVSAEHLLRAWHRAEDLGYQHYEVSNFALPGFESKHNSLYWETQPYIGLGPSASSALDVRDGSRIRFTQPADINGWLAINDHFNLEDLQPDVEVLNTLDAQRESLMLAMRLREGASFATVKETLLEALFDEFIQQGFVTYDSQTSHYLPTEHGWMLGNEMFGAIWCYGKEL